jgi:hypothetical protein
MEQKLLEILKKAKQIDKAAQKFDSSAIKRSSTPGLTTENRFDSQDMLNGIGTSNAINVENYKNSVQKSKLPPEIQRLMLENPISKSDTSFDVNEDDLKEIRGENTPFYDDNDETDIFNQGVDVLNKQIKNKVNNNVNTNFNTNVEVDEVYLRKLISSEISKALPKIIEHYFDSRLVKENIQFKAGNTLFSGTVSPMPKVKKRQ